MPSDKKTILITGGTKGLGRALSLEAGARGYRVWAIYSADQDAAIRLRADFEVRNIEGQCLQQDIRKAAPDFSSLEKSEGPLVLVNNACASFVPTPLHLQTWEDFERQWQVSVKGTYHCTLSILPLMVRRKNGTIVNILTDAMWGEESKGFSSYLTAKYALYGFSKALAQEYRSRGVRTFSVSPGFMHTSLTSTWDPRLTQKMEEGASLLSPEEVAALILDLAEMKDTPGRGENYRLSDPQSLPELRP